MNSYTQEKLAHDHAKGITFHATGLLRLCWYMDATGGTLEDLFGSDSNYADYQARLPNPEKTGEKFDEFCQRIDDWCAQQWNEHEQQLSNCGYSGPDERIIDTLSAFKQVIYDLPWTDKYMLVENRPSKIMYDYNTVASSKELAKILVTTGRFGEWCEGHRMEEELAFVWIEEKPTSRPASCLQPYALRLAPCLRRTLRKLLPTPGYGSNNVYPVEIIEEKIQWECLTHFY